MICNGIFFKLVLKELSTASGETHSLRLPTDLPHSLSSALVLGALEIQMEKLQSLALECSRSTGGDRLVHN